MIKLTQLLICPLVFSLSCSPTHDDVDIEKWKSEVVAVEKAFNDLAQEEGLAKAFAAYAAPDGVIRRSKTIIQGPTAIGDWYIKDYRENETLTWKPDFVDVSSSGDMAYTYGKYVFTSLDSTGTANERTGIFHTVWKKQSDGNWKFVWD